MNMKDTHPHALMRQAIRGTLRNAKVGGTCDLEMRPVTGVH